VYFCEKTGSEISERLRTISSERKRGMGLPPDGETF
jgi:hypothetical protein